MKLPLSQKAASALRVLAETGSTNDDLVAIAGAEPAFSTIVAASQTAGRGRLGRSWVAPPGASLSISVLLRPEVPLERFGWLPLIAGVAMAEAIESLVPGTVGLKWPNDVQIDGLKVSGLLAELLPSGDAVVMGSGVNLALAADQLPTPVSTSLLLAGATLEGDELADAVLSRYLDRLRAHLEAFASTPDVSATLALVTARCTTLGQKVRVELPGANDLHGTATGIDLGGRLLVRLSADDTTVAVAAGDVTHLRYE